jgi:hypothetical protein
MAEDPEALAQLVRLLRDETLRSASAEALPPRVEARFDLLVEGLIVEAVASDDVFDRESALLFLTQRLRFFGDLLTADQRARLVQALRQKIEAW